MRRFILILAATAAAAAAQDIAAQIRAEISRIEQALKDRPISQDSANLLPAVADGLKSAKEALIAGRTLSSLESLERAANLYSAARAMADHTAAVEKGGLPAFETEWSQEAKHQSKVATELLAHDWNRSPAALRALSEVARGKATSFFDGSRGFATSTKPVDGLVYLGQAQGEIEFAQLCASLKPASKARPIAPRSYLGELLALQEKTNAAFQPPRSIEQHPRFIALNSTIKLGRDLDARKLYAGALYQYLEGVRHFGMLDAAAVDDAKKADVQREIAALEAKIDSAREDHSILRMFVERAASQIVHSDGSAPSADELKSARTIVERVAPAYFDSLKAPASGPRTSGKTVEITLVRWPYT